MKLDDENQEHERDRMLMGDRTHNAKTEPGDGGACTWPRKSPPIPETGRRWHVVHSDVRHVKAATDAMRELKYEVYYPQLRIMKPPPQETLSPKQRKQLHLVARPALKPLFSGYPFVRFDLQDGRWHELFDLFGVNGMIVTNGLPAPVHPALIEAIMAMEIGGAIPLDVPLQQLLFKIGQVVRIEETAMAGHTGTIQELDESGQRVLLDILLFGALRSQWFDAEQVAAIS